MIGEEGAAVLGHVAVALDQHRRRLRRDGVRCPAAFGALADALGVMARQGSAPLPDPGTHGDASPVTPDLLTRGDVARALSCSESTADRLIHRGDLPSVRLADGLVRVRTSDLHAYLASLPAARRDPASASNDADH